MFTCGLQALRIVCNSTHTHTHQYVVTLFCNSVFCISVSNGQQRGLCPGRLRPGGLCSGDYVKGDYVLGSERHGATRNYKRWEGGYFVRGDYVRRYYEQQTTAIIQLTLSGKLVDKLSTLWSMKTALTMMCQPDMFDVHVSNPSLSSEQCTLTRRCVHSLKCHRHQIHVNTWPMA